MKIKNLRKLIITPISLVAILALVTGNVTDLSAQEIRSPIIIGDSVSLNSDILKEEREIFIYWPNGYEQETAKYPVLYLLDAEYQFHYTTGVIAFLAEIGYVPKMIVVGIPNTDRNRDLTPEPGEAERKRFPTSGGADDFLDFFRLELIPYIESHYRVQPFKILVGWSLGGLFSIHAMLSQPEIFNAHIAVSPSLYWNGQFEVLRAEEFLSRLPSFNKSLFLTMGNEREEMVTSAQNLSEVLERHSPSGFYWEYKQMSEETHSSIKLKSIYDGLEFIFSDLRLVSNIPDAGFKEYCRNLVRKYGYEAQLSQDFLYGAYSYYWDNKKFEDAVDVVEVFSSQHSASFSGLLPRFVQAGKILIENKLYNRTIQLYELITKANDTIFDVFKGLGDAYFALEKRDQALDYYQKALALRPDDQYVKEQLDKLAKKSPFC